jgi:tetratricopeptide (TPR) repeat protein
MKHITTLLLFFLLTGCAATVTMTNTAPPKAGLPSVHRVAVLPFVDDKGDYVSATFATVLSGLRYQDAAAYTVFDRNLMQEIISEQQFQMTLADPNTAMEFGQLVGVEAGFTGAVRYDQSSRRFQESRTHTVTRTTVINNETVTTSYPETYYVDCYQDDHSMSVSLRLTDYSSTQIIYSNSFSRTLSTKSCSDEAMMTTTNFPSNKNALGTESIALPVLATSSDPYVQMANNIIEAAAKDLGEYTVSITAEIAKKDKTLGDDATDIFESAVDYMKEGDTARACELWGSLQAANEHAPYLTFNLGLCQEISGQYEAALELYDEADRLLGERDELIQGGVQRVKSKIDMGLR